jgi:two-component system, response regulator
MRFTPVFATSPQSIPDLDKLSILLVEDNDADAELIARALRKGLLVNILHRVRDGLEAIEFLAPAGSADELSRDLPGLIFLDLFMPRMDGAEFLRRIKLDARTQKIPIVILASSAEDLDLAESYRLGADSYVVKPPNAAAFAETVLEAALYWLVMKRTIGQTF